MNKTTWLTITIIDCLKTTDQEEIWEQFLLLGEIADLVWCSCLYIFPKLSLFDLTILSLSIKLQGGREKFSSQGGTNWNKSACVCVCMYLLLPFLVLWRQIFRVAIWEGWERRWPVGRPWRQGRASGPTRDQSQAAESQCTGASSAYEPRGCGKGVESVIWCNMYATKNFTNPIKHIIRFYRLKKLCKFMATMEFYNNYGPKKWIGSKLHISCTLVTYGTLGWCLTGVIKSFVLVESWTPLREA